MEVNNNVDVLHSQAAFQIQHAYSNQHCMEPSNILMTLLKVSCIGAFFFALGAFFHTPAMVIPATAAILWVLMRDCLNLTISDIVSYFANLSFNSRPSVGITHQTVYVSNPYPTTSRVIYTTPPVYTTTYSPAYPAPTPYQPPAVSSSQRGQLQGLPRAPGSGHYTQQQLMNAAPPPYPGGFSYTPQTPSAPPLQQQSRIPGGGRAQPTYPIPTVVQQGMGATPAPRPDQYSRLPGSGQQS